MFSRSIRSLSAAALALTGVAVLAPSAQAVAPGWRVGFQFSAQLRDLSGIAASDTHSAWMVGDFCPVPCSESTTTPASYRWNGKHWAPAGITANQVAGLTTVSTSGPTNTWAFGFKSTPTGGVSRSAHWDGHTWVTAGLPNGGSPYGPLIDSSVTLSPKDTWVFGGFYTSGSPAYLAHSTGKTWKQIAAPKKLKPGIIRDAVALSGKDIWALVVEPQLVAGDNGYDVLHYDGKSWTIVKTPANFTSKGGLVVRSKNDIWLAGGRLGSSGQPTKAGAMHFNGTKWSFVPVATKYSSLKSVADDGQGGLWALTTSGISELWHDVKGHWSKVTPSNINSPNLWQLVHIPRTSTTLGIGIDSTGPAIFVTGTF
ncbi:MAG TPA: hypothetical protein VNW94_26880 [Streptosporangiaceae bacterium]|nr:hypothetical protein [Streptosporangiaceae bacterium]